MITTGIFLSHQDISRLSPASRGELERFLFGDPTNLGAPQDGEAEIEAVPPATDEEGPPDLSVAHAKSLYDGCSERPKKALRFVVSQPSTRFSYAKLVDEIGKDSSGTIRGALAAITRRTRTVLGDPKAELFWWQEDDAEAWIGTVSPMTRTSLRKAMGL